MRRNVSKIKLNIDKTERRCYNITVGIVCARRYSARTTYYPINLVALMLAPSRSGVFTLRSETVGFNINAFFEELHYSK